MTKKAEDSEWPVWEFGSEELAESQRTEWSPFVSENDDESMASDCDCHSPTTARTEPLRMPSSVFGALSDDSQDAESTAISAVVLEDSGDDAAVDKASVARTSVQRPPADGSADAWPIWKFTAEETEHCSKKSLLDNTLFEAVDSGAKVVLLSDKELIHLEMDELMEENLCDIFDQIDFAEISVDDLRKMQKKSCQSGSGLLNREILKNAIDSRIEMQQLTSVIEEVVGECLRLTLPSDVSNLIAKMTLPFCEKCKTTMHKTRKAKWHTCVGCRNSRFLHAFPCAEGVFEACAFCHRSVRCVACAKRWLQSENPCPRAEECLNLHWFCDGCKLDTFSTRECTHCREHCCFQCVKHFSRDNAHCLCTACAQLRGDAAMHSFWDHFLVLQQP